AWKPAGIERLHSCAQPARSFANGSRAPRRIDKTGSEGQVRTQRRLRRPLIARRASPWVGRFTAPGRPRPAAPAETPRAHRRYARRRLFPPPSAEGAATPPAPDVVSLRGPGFEQADGVLCLRPRPRALLQPPVQTPGPDPPSAPHVSGLARGIQRAGARRVRCAHHVAPSSAA